MNMVDGEFKTVDEGLEKLRKAVELRGRMGGALYWNIINDDCQELVRKLRAKGADRKEVRRILNGE